MFVQISTVVVAVFTTDTQIICFCDRLDTWESEQNEWLETVKVLRHHRGKLASVSSSCNSSGGMPTKKRKVDLEATGNDG